MPFGDAEDTAGDLARLDPGDRNLLAGEDEGRVALPTQLREVRDGAIDDRVDRHLQQLELVGGDQLVHLGVGGDVDLGDDHVPQVSTLDRILLHALRVQEHTRRRDRCQDERQNDDHSS